jgi:protein-disulfide isomerase
MGLKSTVIQRYVSTGQADYRWHDFPLPVHDKAIEAASAARCAGPAADQVRHQIMAHQGEMTPAAYAQYARAAGADMNEYAECTRSGQSRQAVMADKQLGQSYGVRGTPTLVLGITDAQGRVKPVQVVKAYDPPQQVLAQIDAFLAKAKPQASR